MSARGSKITLCLLHGADHAPGHCEITLPARIAWVGFGEALGNGEAVLVGFQRGDKVALRHLPIAHVLVADRQVALPARIAWGRMWRGARQWRGCPCRISARH